MGQLADPENYTAISMGCEVMNFFKFSHRMGLILGWQYGASLLHLGMEGPFPFQNNIYSTNAFVFLFRMQNFHS